MQRTYVEYAYRYGHHLQADGSLGVEGFDSVKKMLRRTLAF